jgi:hypothetical protein
MRIVALDTIHFLLKHRMMLRKVKIHFCGAVALETSGGVFARIDDEFATPATALDMQAAGAMARLAAGLANPGRRFQMNPRVSAGGKDAGEFSMAFHARLVADKVCARNFRRSLNRSRYRGTGVESQRDRGEDGDGQEGESWVARVQEG